MASVIRFVVLVLAIYRATRLIIQDEILADARDWAFEHVAPGGKLYYLLTCYWCLSFWIAIPFSILYIARPNGMMVAGLPLASSAIVGFISQKVG